MTEMGELRIGASSFSAKGWVGPFYPAGTPRRNGTGLKGTPGSRSTLRAGMVSTMRTYPQGH
jgi:hypothetical protein